MRLSIHSIQRYQQRVAPGTSSHAAARRLTELAADATCRPRPRHWTPAPPWPGTTFLYPHARPDLCLIVREDVVVTVVDRASAKQWASSNRLSVFAERRRLTAAYRRPAPGAALCLDEAA
jgi:hypothetical protein